VVILDLMRGHNYGGIKKIQNKMDISLSLMVENEKFFK